MSDVILNDRYEISLWDDVLVTPEDHVYEYKKTADTIKLNNKVYYTRSGSKPNYTYTEFTGETFAKKTKYYEYVEVNPAHYEEEKIITIASSEMETPWRAINPVFTSNINGTHKLSFTVYYTYVDTITGEKMTNPLIGQLLINERKVKLYYQDKWYDLVIKNVQENSDQKSITYQCEDLFITELSKNGYDLVLDGELMNNSGTAAELIETVLEDTDWQLNGDGSDDIKQWQEEPVFEVYFANSVTVDSRTITTNEPILVYYSMVIPSQNPFFQFAINKDPAATTFIRDNNTQLVNRDSIDCLGIDGVTYAEIEDEIYGKGWEISFNETLLCTIYQNAVSTRYRAERLVRSQVSKVDSILQKTVYQFKQTDDQQHETIYWGYESSTHEDVNQSRNLISNYTNFDSTSGWSGDNLTWYPFPQPSNGIDIETYNPIVYLRLKGGIYYQNSGLYDNKSLLENGFQKGDIYLVRIKAYMGSSTTPTSNLIGVAENTPTIGINCFDFSGSDWEPYFTRQNSVSDPTNSAYPIKNWQANTDYEINDRRKYNNVDYICTIKHTSGNSFDSTKWEKDQYYYIQYKCIKTLKQSDISSVLTGFALRIQGESDQYYWLKSVEFFKKVKDNNGNVIFPDDYDKTGGYRSYYYLYDAAEAPNWTKAEDYIYNVVPSDSIGEYTPIYAEGYSKIRTITAKESNRFNILQSIAETFQCWLEFSIQHDTDGKITCYDGDTYIGPRKFVTIKNTLGQERGYGFIYGVDLKTIQRTLESNELVTKTIVPHNSNEFGLNGFSSIARSSYNYPKTNFILNFDYFVSHGLLDAGVLTNDLYSNITENGIGYYYWLHHWNSQFDEYTKELEALQLAIIQQKSWIDIYQGLVTQNDQKQAQAVSDLMYITNTTTWNDAVRVVKSKEATDTMKAKLNAYKQAKANSSTYRKLAAKCEKGLTTLQNKYDKIEEDQQVITDAIKDLDLRFYTKYSRFLQEGSWISEDYFDDNLYYLDAESVAYISSRPIVQYQISVLRLTSLDEFKGKVFEIGDRGFIEDTEFFGYVEKDGIKTPYQEEILISETTVYLDEHNKDTFTVQNYKTQFEDLFQRITATTQSLQFASGTYEKASAAFNTDGTLKTTTLQNSFAANQNLVINSVNNAIVQDNTGITIYDTTNPNNVLKLTAGGIVLSNDGGVTWKSGVKGSGISTEQLTSGQLDTNRIQIMSGTYPTFRWDETGLNAYTWNQNGIQFDQFVRLDQYGLYGVKNYNVNKYVYYVTSDTAPVQGKTYYVYNSSTGGYSEATNLPEDFTTGTTLYYEQTHLDQQEFIPTSEDDTNDPTSVWNNAQYALTWKGFMLKTDGGAVKITSDNDIGVYDSSNYNRVQIGRLNAAGTVFGIRINEVIDDQEVAVMETGSDGKLWLKNLLKVGDGINSTVKIGYDTENTRTGTNAHEVINAGSGQFTVYEDGYIIASAGQIGNMSIADINQKIGNLVTITSNVGTIITNNSTSIALTADVTTEATVVKYKWIYKGQPQQEEISSAKTNTLSDISSGGLDVGNNIYICEVTLSENGSTYTVTSQINIEKITLQATVYRIESNTNLVNRAVESGNTVFNYNDLILEIFDQSTQASPSSDNCILELTYLQGSEKSTINLNTILLDDDNPEIVKNCLQFINSDSGNVSIHEAVLHIQTLIDIDADDIVWEEGSQYEKFIDIQNLLRASDCEIVASYESSGTQAISSISFRWASTKNLASFDINAFNISAAIDNHELVFGSDGLTIYNSGFQMLTTGPWQQDQVSMIDPSDYSTWVVEESYSVGDKVKIDVGYEITSDEEPQSGKTYYTKSGDVYTVWSGETFESGVTYYEMVTNYYTCIRSHISSNDNSPLAETFERTLYVDESGNLKIHGELEAATGTFSGNLEGANGTFNGAIAAQTGTIGGFIIEDHNIHSLNEDLCLYDNGKVIANNIVLGDSATIANKIEFINDNYISGIYNPVENNHLFLKTNNFEVKDTGELTIGEINIDGADSIITATQGLGGYKLTPTECTFYNATITGKIVSAIFETQKTSAVGGNMVFKQSYEIELIPVENDDSILEVTFIDENISIDFENHNFVFIDSTGTLLNNIYKITKSSNKYYCSMINDYSNIKTCIDLGVESVTNHNTVIAINGNDSDMLFGSPYTLTFNDLFISDNTLQVEPKLILGYLPEGNSNFSAGCGLYADNVYLNGQLVTQSDTDNTYTGINTLTRVESESLKGDDDEPLYVAIWAGALTRSDSDIGKAPFQITTDGSLYANKGVFEGAILSNSKIQASEIYATGFYGINEEGIDDALRLYDLTKGIQFMSGRDENSVPQLQLVQSAFTFNNNGIGTENTMDFNFITFGVDGNNNIVDFKGSSLIVDNLRLDNRSLGTYSTNSDSGEITFNSQIYFSNNQEIQMKFGSVETMSLTTNNITLQKDTQFNGEVVFGTAQKQSYRASDSSSNYYDLYII